MTTSELLKWQWEGYPRYHQSRTNLALHIVVVPLFLLGNVAFVLGILSPSWENSTVGIALTLLSIFAQGRGHRIESVPPEPFTSAGNAVSRIFLEQWITFPRFVVSGGWAKNWARAISS